MADPEQTEAGENPRETLPRSPALVGRERELAELRGGLADALGGRGRLFLIAGEPGIGKTRLAEELAREAADRGMLVLAGHCHEMEGGTPYMPFVEILETGLARAPSLEVYRESLGDEATEVARIMPRLRRLFPDIPKPPGLPAEHERRYFFNGICEVVARGARGQPLFLLVEDLQWADEPTLLLTEHLAQRLPAMPVFVLGTYRDVDLDVSRPLARSLERLFRRRLARRIRLPRLSAGEVEQMLRGLSGDEPPASLTRAIYQETDGNAFFVEEVFRHLVEERALLDGRGRFRSNLDLGEIDVPESVRLTIGKRLERLSETARKVLTTAAMVGRDFPFKLLEALAVTDDEALLAALEEAERAGVIASFTRGGEARFAFSHELVRQTLIAPLSLPRKQRLHLDVAEATRRVYATSIDEQAGELAYHYYEAGSVADSEEVAPLLVVAGDGALRGAAFEEALRHYERALAFRRSATLERADLLRKLGQARLSLGRNAEAFEAWEEALTTYERLGDVESVGRLCRQAALQYGWSARFGEALQMMERGLAALGDRSSADRCCLLSMRGVLFSVTSDHETGERMIGEAMRMAERLGDDEARAWVLHNRSLHHFASMRLEQMLEDARQAVALLRPMRSLWELAGLLSIMQLAELNLGHFEEVTRIGLELEPLADRIGNADAMILAAWYRAFQELARTGDLGKLADLGTHVERCRGAASGRLTGALTVAGLAHFWDGSWEEALAHIGEAAAYELPSVDGNWGLLALVQAYAGRREQAMRLLAERANELPRPGRVNDLGSWIALFCAVETLVVAGERERAAELYPLLLEAIAMGIVLCPLYSLRLVQTVAGMAAGAARRWEEAEEHFRKALRQADELPNRIEQAEARRFYAGMLLDRRDPGDVEQALALLGEAAAAYERMRMPKHREMAEALLRSAGPSGPSAAGPVPFASALLRREGDFWTIHWQGNTFRLKDSKGLAYLQNLIREPGRELHCVDILGEETVDLGDAGEVLDAEAKAAYRRRLEDLHEELTEAESNNDPGRATKAREEIEFLGQELSSAVGLGGRDRRASANVERARIRVTRGIREAIKRIGMHDASLGRHLSNAIRTGAFCSYTPDPTSPVTWKP